ITHVSDGSAHIPYTTLFRSDWYGLPAPSLNSASVATCTSLPTRTVVPSAFDSVAPSSNGPSQSSKLRALDTAPLSGSTTPGDPRSEEHTSELQSPRNLVCAL